MINKEKKDLHIIRKLGHMLPGFLFAGYYLLLDEQRSFMEMAIMKIFIVATFFDFLRLRNPKINRGITKLFSKFMRKEELDANSGMPSYLASMAIISSIFPTEAIVLSILYLAICDPLASLIGLICKEHRYNVIFDNNKSLFGLGASFGSSLIITLIIGIFSFNWSFSDSFTIGVIVGIVVSLVEGFPLEGVNDNLLIPISSAIILMILFQIIGVEYGF